MLRHRSDLPQTLYGVKKKMQIVFFPKTPVVSLEILIEYRCPSPEKPHKCVNIESSSTL